MHFFEQFLLQLLVFTISEHETQSIATDSPV